MTQLFLASSPMNILKSLVMIQNLDNSSYLLIEVFDKGATLNLDYYENLKAKIDQLSIKNLLGVEIVISPKKMIGRLESLITDLNLDLSKVSDVYTANVWTTGISKLTRWVFQRYRFSRKVKIHVVEDGTKMYLGNFEGMQNPSLKRRVKALLLSDLNVLDSPKIFDWIVEDKSHYGFVRRPLHEFKLTSYRENLRDLTKLFLTETDIRQLEQLSNTSDRMAIVFTQPLFKSGLIKSIDQQVQIVNSLINKFSSSDYSFFLKLHPADKADYSKVDVPVTILGNFPSEFFEAFDVNFDMSLGLFSSAVESVKALIYVYDVSEYNKRAIEQIKLNI